jgi:hypothetical protein
MKFALYAMTAALLAGMSWSVMASGSDAMTQCEKHYSRSTCIYMVR